MLSSPPLNIEEGQASLSPTWRSGRRLSRSFVRVTIIAAVFVVSLLSYFGTSQSKRPIQHFPSHHTIPNIAHFVRQVNRDAQGVAQPVKFEFRHFMAYYSVIHYAKPDQVNVWTDASQENLDRARLQGDTYTKAVLNLPGLTFRYREMPTNTSKGVPLVKYAHRSDFARSNIMYEHGGMYFDDDVWVIKDLAPLRNTGFDNVLGRQQGGSLCQAMWLSTPKNDFMKAWITLQETEFDGHWSKASNQLISQLALDMAGTGHDKHTLILDRDTFFPGSWKEDAPGLDMMYKLHPDDGSVKEDSERRKFSSVEEVIENYRLADSQDWRRDWHLTYAIHGWSNGIRDGHLEQKYFQQYKALTPEYVLSRQSNVGRALYAALTRAIELGYLTETEALF